MAVEAKQFAGQDRKFFTLEKFGSLNTKNQRPSIQDNEFSWIENMMPIGDGNLRTMWSNGPAIYTAPGGLTIIYMYFYNIGSTTYCAVFLNDGTAVQVNTQTLGHHYHHIGGRHVLSRLGGSSTIPRPPPRNTGSRGLSSSPPPRPMAITHGTVRRCMRLVPPRHHG